VCVCVRSLIVTLVFTVALTFRYENYGNKTFSGPKIISLNASGATDVIGVDLDGACVCDVCVTMCVMYVCMYDVCMCVCVCVCMCLLRESHTRAYTHTGDGDIDVVSSSDSPDKIAWCVCVCVCVRVSVYVCACVCVYA